MAALDADFTDDLFCVWRNADGLSIKSNILPFRSVSPAPRHCAIHSCVVHDGSVLQSAVNLQLSVVKGNLFDSEDADFLPVRVRRR